jgi:D-cysteine desulfhydrase
MGNLCLEYLMGAELHFVGVDKTLEGRSRMKALREAGETKVQELKELYLSKGLIPYVVPRGGQTTQGTAGYLVATLEIHQQLIDMRIKADYIVMATGSTSTTGSLILGNRVFNTGIRVVGISVSRPKDECKARILEQIEKDRVFYAFEESVKDKDITVFDDYIGPGYAIPTGEGVKAIKLLASKEAIVLDQIYTGKAMAGLIDLIRKGFFRRDETVIFLHTGGGPGLFTLDDRDFRSS